MLEIKGLSAKYGGATALREVSLAIPHGSVVAILGSNGAGKSTLLNTIMGSRLMQASGSIKVAGEEILGKTTEHIIKAGIALVPEGRQLFGDLTVDENLKVGAYLQRDSVRVTRQLEEVRELFPRLAERRNQRAATLSGGEQQMVAIGRALMSAPRLLLLDEPSLGLAPVLVTEIMRLIRRINERGVTIVLVEQNARQALSTATEAHVIESGKVTLSGEARQLAANPHVVSAYLGA